MDLKFLKRTAADRALIIQETAAQRNVLAVMVEKDFWVSWTLAVLFAHSEFGRQLVFKGGTSLSKVFGVIGRFSEDIDLSVSPEFLGMNEKILEQAGSRHQRETRMKELETKCIASVEQKFLPELEEIANDVLGPRPGGAAWMKFQIDPLTDSPVVLFHYPTNDPSSFTYLVRFVKMEFGSLTDQRPVGTHNIRPWVAEQFPQLFEDFQCQLVALELERTFWEKATILHSEYHRDPKKPIRDRFSRHYSDMAALAQHAIVDKALACDDLRQRVADWKSRFFAASWAKYDEARPGTFRLVPPEFRQAELERDYQAMQDMFLAKPPPFRDILETIRILENRINQPK